MEELLLYLVQQGFLNPGDQLIPINLPPEENTDQRIRVRQLISYLLEDLVGVKNALPAKMFTERYPAVKYPTSIRKKYSQFGLQLEDLVIWKLQQLYSTFSGAKRLKDVMSEELLVGCLSEKDIGIHLGKITKQLQIINDYFEANFPPSKIHKVAAEVELSHGIVVGHPDLVVWTSPDNVVIFDVKVFWAMKLSTSREIRAQLSIYATLARSQNLECQRVGVILPWLRDPPVRIYDISKWDSQLLLKKAEACAEKVRRTPANHLKWSALLRQYNVGSHISKNDALKVIRSGETKTPFQIFLYGNNPSASTEQKGRNSFSSMFRGKLFPFKNYNAFVHAPYNLNLASEETYVVTAAKMYLGDAYRYGFRGVIFHVGHHANADVGVSIMAKTITQILSSAHPETPFILETPCGNKNELLPTPESFGEFLMRFPETLCGACLDTCHVFVSGYIPLVYIDKMGSASDRICLFHFNGSRKKQGCHADGHGHVTRIQNIPDEQLMSVLEIAKKWEVCSVTE